MLVQVGTDNKRTDNSPKQLNYAVGRLVAVIVYCLRQFKSIGKGSHCGIVIYLGSHLSLKERLLYTLNKLFVK